MRTVFILLSVLCISVFAQDTLKVMTYNLEGMKPGTDPETRLFHIIQKLKVLDPDIIGLQEINELLNGANNQGQRIADSLSAHFGVPYHFYQSFTHLSWNNQFREYIGIISKYPVQNQGFLSLVPGVFPRKVVWNYIDTPLGMVNMFNTHLSYNSSTVRVQQVQQIIAYIIQKETAHSGIASILSGDFNDPPTAPTIQLLTNTGGDTFYVDSYADANPGDPGYTVPSGAPNTRIDYIFLKNTGSLTVFDSRVVMDQPYSGNNYCSDHLGVLSRFTLFPTGINAGQGSIPRQYHLEQNYPNPFNPITNVEFGITGGAGWDAEWVTLTIYDLLGREVKTLVNERLGTGRYTVQWNGTNDAGKPAASGVYLYQLTVGQASQDRPGQASLSFTQTHKMVLLR